MKIITVLQCSKCKVYMPLEYLKMLDQQICCADCKDKHNANQ